VRRFDSELRFALSRLGFAVSEDSAECFPEVTVEQRSADDMRMSVLMANGSVFTFKLKPQHFLEKAEEEA